MVSQSEKIPPSRPFRGGANLIAVASTCWRLQPLLGLLAGMQLMIRTAIGIDNETVR